MILNLEYQGIYLSYYYYQIFKKRINVKELTEITDQIKCDMISIILTTTIPSYTIQNKIKPIEYLSPI